MTEQSEIDELRELRDLVRNATGADRQLDDEIDWGLSEYRNLGGWWRAHKLTGNREKFSYVPAAPVSSSLDAAVALVERMLPGWVWSCGSCSVTHDATVRPPWRSPAAWMAPDMAGPDAGLLDDRRFNEGFHGDRRDGNACLALLDSLLSALIARAERGVSE